MRYLIILILLASSYLTNAQYKQASKKIDGKYTTFFAEKGVKGMSHEKLIQYSEMGDKKMIAIAACEQCFPAIYSYNEEQSKESDRLVHYNSLGIYLVQYDTDSFVVVMPSIQANKDFEYINFYSKNKSTVAQMTQKKLEAFGKEFFDMQVDILQSKFKTLIALENNMR